MHLEEKNSQMKPPFSSTGYAGTKGRLGRCSWSGVDGTSRSLPASTRTHVRGVHTHMRIGVLLASTSTSVMSSLKRSQRTLGQEPYVT